MADRMNSTVFIDEVVDDTLQRRAIRLESTAIEIHSNAAHPCRFEGAQRRLPTPRAVKSAVSENQYVFHWGSCDFAQPAQRATICNLTGYHSLKGVILRT